MFNLNILIQIVILCGAVFAADLELCNWDIVEVSRFSINKVQIEKTKFPAILYTRILTTPCLPNINYDTCFIDNPTCNSSIEFITYDGSCNNLQHPTWGMTSTTATRILPVYYSDGRHLPALALDGSELPNARALSVAFFPDERQDDDITLICMQWGQFVTHDLMNSIIVPAPKDCCAISNTTVDFYNDCLPIYFASDDPFFSKYNKTCQNMIRINTTFSGDKCQNLEQINFATHSIDGSQIYGATKQVVYSLREFSRGRLQDVIVNGQEFLPKSSPNTCLSNYCFISGDFRVNQNTELTVLQILFLREHNRITENLSILNPNWDDEILYRKTRSIVVAMIQHITYSHWLPLFLGQNLMENLKISVDSPGYTTHNANVPMMILNEFSQGVLRSLHAGIQGILTVYNYRRNPLGSVNISDWMNNPDIMLQESNYDGFLLGLITQKMRKIEASYSSEMTEKLFHGSSPFGQDLESFDINRGRDAGIVPYIYLLESCTGQKIGTFDDLSTVIPKDKILKLQTYYKNVADVDLFIAIHLEKIVPGTRFGPTSLCILGEQFYRSMYGDRFWYTHGGLPNTFPKDQLREIRKSSISRLICDNSNNIVNVTQNVFLPSGPLNPIISCEDIPQLNLSKWQE